MAGLLILAVFLASSLMSLRTSLFGNLQMSDAAKASSRLLGERIRTVIGVTSTNVDGACGLTIEIENTGATAVHSFPEMDVIFQYPLGINQAAAMVYTSSAPILGQWTAASISGGYEPTTWNPGERLTIQTQVPLLEPGDGVVTIGTPNGVVIEIPFTGLIPC